MSAINRQKFLAELAKLLTFMYEEDRQLALRIYERMFDSVEDEYALIHGLVSPTRQAVIIARAYDAKERKLSVSSSSKDEDGYEEGDEIPPFVLEINRVFTELFPGNAPFLYEEEDQFSLFEREAKETGEFAEPTGGLSLEDTQEFKLDLDDYESGEDESEPDDTEAAEAVTQSGAEAAAEAVRTVEESGSPNFDESVVPGVDEILADFRNQAAAEAAAEAEAAAKAEAAAEAETAAEAGTAPSVSAVRTDVGTEPSDAAEEKAESEAASETDTDTAPAAAAEAKEDPEAPAETDADTGTESAGGSEPEHTEQAGDAQDNAGSHPETVDSLMQGSEKEPFFQAPPAHSNQNSVEHLLGFDLPEGGAKVGKKAGTEKDSSRSFRTRRRSASLSQRENRTGQRATADRSRRVPKEEKELPPAERKPKVPLLVLFLIVAVPLTAALAALLLVPTLIFLGVSLGMTVLGGTLIISAFSGFAVLADIMLLLGAAIVALAFGLLFLWLFFCMISDGIVGLVRKVAALCRAWCYEEVSAK
ncbi:MAG: hypothetical protein K6C12_00900 [Oscillospiraceae bacterium]|nr:hypothetical protein [Oscillospiraceae bacterium]